MVQKTEDNKTALIIIDIQNDYFPGGTMELASADDTSESSERIVLFRRRNACYPRATLALQEGAFFYPIQKVLKSIKV
jgi:nicotinamidase-related amidase